jgi:putative PIN family toxin of toxin-antitoxin system
MLKAVLDTNVLVSSLLVKVGLPAQVVDAWRQQQYILVSSPDLIAEVRATLNYPRLRRKYPLTDEDVGQLINLLQHDALLVPGQAQVSGVIPADPADEMVLACAVDAEADVIVSGDLHLLALWDYQGIPILTARAFLERLAEEG